LPLKTALSTGGRIFDHWLLPLQDSQGVALGLTLLYYISTTKNKLELSGVENTTSQADG
jgi:hypothetical protein